MIRSKLARRGVVAVSMGMSAVFAAIGIMWQNPYMFVAPLFLVLYNIATLLGEIAELLGERDGKGE